MFSRFILCPRGLKEGRIAGSQKHPWLETEPTSVQSPEVLEWLILELNVIYRQALLPW